ncbi:hypothetical protein UFOVP1382_103 [uncultured Caudovirales phage]|uniref:DUF1292 domain-containing protein n=1 Tax=uncultured Caudovirales phage TaxID=2100421 RepID=A0A6J5S3V3_9CAUD|nr:hypothetical protein UFOVP1382_103 [uncultured Caudovirales phage]
MTDDERFEEDIAALRRIYAAAKGRVGHAYSGLAADRDSDTDRVTTVEFGQRDDTLIIIGVSEMHERGTEPVYAVEEFEDGEMVGTTTDCATLEEALVEFEARDYVEALEVAEEPADAMDWN